MRLLLDSHILLAIQRRDTIICTSSIDQLVRSAENEKTVSVASLWEMAIKHRLGKLALDVPIAELPNAFLSLRFSLLNVDHHHAVEELDVLPPTRDPFDRLLLAQCQVEGMRLVTLDRALARHPLAWRDK
jgi:PIN domain nuclease of toxin-antitoxin system